MENAIPPNISEVAREMQRRSVVSRSIKGTETARKRATKAGKLAWSKRIKEAFISGFQMRAAMQPNSLIDAELAWEIWQRSQVNKVKHQIPP